MYTYKNVSIQWLGHDWFLITYKDKNICIDPFELKDVFYADYIFITHNHRDHLSIDDIKKIIQTSTLLIAPCVCSDDLKDFPNQKIFFQQEDTHLIDDFSVSTIPAYCIDKFRSPWVPYHPKQAWFVGYIFDFEGTKIYHAWDTDNIPEMQWLSPDIALLPVSWTYTMTAEEAVQSLKRILPKVAIPMHYDAIVGSLEDAKYFQAHAQCEVVIL